MTDRQLLVNLAFKGSLLGWKVNFKMTKLWKPVKILSSAVYLKCQKEYFERCQTNTNYKIISNSNYSFFFGLVAKHYN